MLEGNFFLCCDNYYFFDFIWLFFPLLLISSGRPFLCERQYFWLVLLLFFPCLLLFPPLSSPFPSPLRRYVASESPISDLSFSIVSPHILFSPFLSFPHPSLSFLHPHQFYSHPFISSPISPPLTLSTLSTLFDSDDCEEVLMKFGSVTPMVVRLDSKNNLLLPQQTVAAVAGKIKGWYLTSWHPCCLHFSLFSLILFFSCPSFSSSLVPHPSFSCPLFSSSLVPHYLLSLPVAPVSVVEEEDDWEEVSNKLSSATLKDKSEEGESLGTLQLSFANCFFANNHLLAVNF